MRFSRLRSNASLAFGYAAVLGAYFGLVVGLKINPDFLDHWPEQAYAILIIPFGIALHTNRTLSALVAWTAYGFCFLIYLLVAVAFDQAAPFPIADVITNSTIVFCLFAFAGLFAQAIGLTARKYLLPPKDKMARFTQGLLAWLPLIVIVAMTLNTIERHFA